MRAWVPEDGMPPRMSQRPSSTMRTGRETDMDVETIERNYGYAEPDGGQVARYRTIRAEAKSLAITVEGLCPDSREKSLAMTKIEEAVMWASASIARNETGEGVEVDG